MNSTSGVAMAQSLCLEDQPTEKLLFWSDQVLRYLNLKHLAVGLNQEEERLLDGLREALMERVDSELPLGAKLSVKKI